MPTASLPSAPARHSAPWPASSRCPRPHRPYRLVRPGPPQVAEPHARRPPRPWRRWLSVRNQRPPLRRNVTSEASSTRQLRSGRDDCPGCPGPRHACLINGCITTCDGLLMTTASLIIMKHHHRFAATLLSGSRLRSRADFRPPPSDSPHSAFTTSPDFRLLPVPPSLPSAPPCARDKAAPRPRARDAAPGENYPPPPGVD